MVNESELLGALDIVAFEVMRSRVCRPVGAVPERLARRFPAVRADALDLGQLFPFLSTWIEELESLPLAEPKRAGPWSQADAEGLHCQLTATAVLQGGVPHVLIEFAGPGSQRLQAVLQAAREQKLVQETLEKTQAALERARAELEERVAERTSELVGANQRLLDYQAQLRALVDQVGVAEERERRRIATYLHDHVGQSLAVAKMKLGMIGLAAPAEIVTEFGELSGLLDTAIKETRTLTFELAPPVLYELGLASALESLCKRFERDHRIPTHSALDGSDRAVDSSLSTLLYQSVRELLHNIIKHAAPARIDVHCVVTSTLIEVSVRDDGAGFESEHAAKGPGPDGGFGLFNIRERLNQIGGGMKIESSPGNGALVTLCAPLHPTDPPAEQRLDPAEGAPNGT